MPSGTPIHRRTHPVHQTASVEHVPDAGLHEALLSRRLEQALEGVPNDRLVAQLTDLWTPSPQTASRVTLPVFWPKH